MATETKLNNRKKEVRELIAQLDELNALWHMTQSRLMTVCGVNYFNTHKEIVDALNVNKPDKELKPFFEALEECGQAIKATKIKINKLV